MARFLFIYRGGDKARNQMDAQERQEHHETAKRWLSNALRAGWMVSMGDGLTKEGRVVSDKVVTDGPFVETKEIIGGFSIIEAENIDAAAKLTKDCPFLHIGGKIEVRRLAGFTTEKMDCFQ
jgi:hypothetical protein